MTKLLNISGTGRSGTTITKELLGQNPEIATVPGREMRLLCDPDGLLDLYRTLLLGPSPYVFDRAIKRFDIAYHQIMQGSKLTAAAGFYSRSKVGTVMGRVVSPRYMGITGGRFLSGAEDLLSCFYDELGVTKFEGRYIGSNFFEKEEMYFWERPDIDIKVPFSNFMCSYVDGLTGSKKVLCEDNPFSFYCHSQYEELLGDDHRMIFVLRDPRDIVSSSSTMSWAPSDLAECARYIHSILVSLENLDGMKVVRLEDLVSNPQQVLDSITDHFQLTPFDYDLSAVSSSSMGRYKSMPAKDIETLNSIFHEVLVAYGYD